MRSSSSTRTRGSRQSKKHGARSTAGIMTKAKGTAPEGPELAPAGPEQEPVIANMLELYAHDFSEFHAIELGPDGRFGYANLPLYWKEPGRYAFLVKMDGRLAGFVLVKRGSQLSKSDAIWDMAEFFV